MGKMIYMLGIVDITIMLITIKKVACEYYSFMNVMQGKVSPCP